MKRFILVGTLLLLILFFTSFTFAQPSIGSGDADGNGKVDSSDLVTVLRFYGKSSGATNGLPVDQYGDDVINLIDLRYVLMALLNPTPTTVPPTLTVIPNTPTPSPRTPTPTSTPTPTRTLPTPTDIVSGNQKIICDGKTFSRWGGSTPITIGGSSDDANGNIQKVIRNCVFSNPAGVASSKAAIDIKQGNNILIENSRFDNIRTLKTGDGVHAINIPGGGATSNVIIRNSFFNDIGADGSQLGASGPNIRNIRFENNEFVGSEAVGENAVDVKGVYGPIYITGNKIHGFRPCQSPKTNPSGNQDCSGSTGPGIVIHVGSTGFVPADIFIQGNDIYDNTHGINVSGGKNVVVSNNQIHDNLKTGVLHSGGELKLSGNTYSNNPNNCSGISPCQ